MKLDVFALLNDSEYRLNEVIQDDSEPQPGKKNHFSFEQVTEAGEVVGYIKAWQEGEDYAGFVHFDNQCNVVEWKVFSKSHNSKRRPSSSFANYTSRKLRRA